MHLRPFESFTAGGADAIEVYQPCSVDCFPKEIAMERIPPRQDKTGYLYVSAAALLFAVSGTVAKSLFNAGLTPYHLIQLRTTLAFGGLWAWLLLRDPLLLRISVKDLPYFIGLGVLGIGSAQFFYLFAISKINVATAILLHYTGPVFVALYLILFQAHKPEFRTFTAITGTLVGCFLVVGAYDLQLVSSNRLGILAGLLAAVSFAVYSVLSERGMRKYSPWTVLLYGMLFAAMMWNLLSPPFGAFTQRHSALQWVGIVFIAIFGTIIPFGLYFQGVKRIQPTHASITATLEPISAGIVAALFLGEAMLPLQVLGGGLVIASILILQLNSAQS